MKWLPTILFSLPENLSVVIVNMQAKGFVKVRSERRFFIFFLLLSASVYTHLNEFLSVFNDLMFLFVTFLEIHTKEEEKAKYFKQIFSVSLKCKCVLQAS